MSQINATANAHMRRDIEGGGKWACQCEQRRSLLEHYLKLHDRLAEVMAR
jgi:hypothetical protein